MGKCYCIWLIKFHYCLFSVLCIPGYNGNFCEGNCPFPLVSSFNGTNHSLVQAILHAKRFKNNDHRIPSPCCVPDNFQQLSILYDTGESQIVLKAFEDMIATSCACLWTPHTADARNSPAPLSYTGSDWSPCRGHVMTRRWGAIGSWYRSAPSKTYHRATLSLVDVAPGAPFLTALAPPVYQLDVAPCLRHLFSEAPYQTLHRMPGESTTHPKSLAYLIWYNDEPCVCTRRTFL